MFIYAFDPIKIGKLETELWREYYGRNYFKMISTIKRIFEGHSKDINILKITRLLFTIIFSQILFIKSKITGKENKKSIISLLVIFNQSLNINSDYKNSAKIEYEWWKRDREMKGKKSKLRRDAICSTVGSLYNLSPDYFLEYAHKWEEAALLFDNIDGQEVEKGDWKKCEQLLIEAYTSLHQVVNSKQN